MFDIPFYPRIKGKIGILGGSFNPAHEGHVHISNEARKRLGLTQVWWLVSPYNPIKKKMGVRVRPYKERLSFARKLTDNMAWLRVTPFEERAGTHYTYDSLSLLRKCYPDVEFVWLMGADNLVQFDRWHRSDALMQSMPIAVCSRDKKLHRAMRSVTAQRYASRRIGRTQDLYESWGYWQFLPIKESSESSTKLRSSKGIAGYWGADYQKS